MSFKRFYENKYSTRIENLNPMKLQALSLFPSPPRTVLDVGCGTGMLAGLLSEAGYKVVGIDLSDVAVQKCRARGIEAYQQDLAEKLQFSDNTFDCILMSEVIEHLVDPIQVLKELRRVLKINGVMVITTPNSSFITRRFRYLIGKSSTETQNFSHLRFFSADFLKRVVTSAGFSIVHFLGYLFNPFNMNTGFVLRNLINLFSENFIVVLKK
ncbi:class I SAM-dependent methyltransferase [archaeon]|nr:class I SAM-dependent methyltransferase [archaeon]